jgi:hypothetical protein
MGFLKTKYWEIVTSVSISLLTISCQSQKTQFDRTVYNPIEINYVIQIDTIENIFKINSSNHLTIQRANGNLSLVNLDKYKVVNFDYRSNSISEVETIYNRSYYEFGKNDHPIFSALMDDTIQYYVNQSRLFKISLNDSSINFIDDLSLFTNLKFNEVMPYESIFSYTPAIVVMSDSAILMPISLNSNNMIGLYNLRSKELKVQAIEYPHFYSEINYRLQNHYSLCQNQERIFMSFTQKPYIFELDLLNNNNIDTFVVKSAHDTLPEIKFKKKTSFLEKFTRTILYDGNYRSLVFNSFKNHYYLVYSIGQPEKNATGLRNTIEDKRLSFMILNKSFEVVSEQILPSGIFSTIRIFPTKNGAYLFSPLPEENRNKNKNMMLKTTIKYE